MTARNADPGYLTPTDRARMRDSKAFVIAWFEHERSYWSWGGLSALCVSEPDEAWRLILLLVANAPSDAALSIVGFVPLTELILAHGEALIDRIEAEAARDPRFRRCLTSVCQEPCEPDIPEALWSRIERAQLPRPV